MFSLHDAWHLVEENVDFFEDYEAEVILVDRVDLKVGRKAGLNNASNVLQVGEELFADFKHFLQCCLVELIVIQFLKFPT